MKKTKTYLINDTHFAVCEIDGSNLLIWIERKTKVFFGLFNWHNRIGSPVLFRLGNEDRCGCSITGGFAGRIMTLTENCRKIELFDLECEISVLYHKVLYREQQQKIREKLIDHLTDL